MSEPLVQHHQGDEARLAYATHMRKLFSPPGMLNSDGSINQDFFKPKKVVTVTERRWGEYERQKLYKGLEKHGVGKWRDIGTELLPGWDENSIRLKAAKLLGCQNLSWYQGRRFTRAEAEFEFESNKQVGAQTGCWKQGMLVNDSKGILRAHLQVKQKNSLQPEFVDMAASDIATVQQPCIEAVVHSIQSQTADQAPEQ
eukprot:GHRR01007733.1.p1 GENE.GHRR01007733.1~~GHRR01007733.1.p1  ORF type:complete len:199 (+),score=46.31 GHRR01007733.1:559-1155(+)